MVRSRTSTGIWDMMVKTSLEPSWPLALVAKQLIAMEIERTKSFLTGCFLGSKLFVSLRDWSMPPPIFPDLRKLIGSPHRRPGLSFWTSVCIYWARTWHKVWFLVRALAV